MGWRPSRSALRAAWEAEDLKTGAGGWVCTAWALVVGDGDVVRQRGRGRKGRRRRKKMNNGECSGGTGEEAR